MSSSVSLVPTTQKVAAKKRRPAFRPQKKTLKTKTTTKASFQKQPTEEEQPVAAQLPDSIDDILNQVEGGEEVEQFITAQVAAGKELVAESSTPAGENLDANTEPTKKAAAVPVPATGAKTSRASKRKVATGSSIRKPRAKKTRDSSSAATGTDGTKENAPSAVPSLASFCTKYKANGKTKSKEKAKAAAPAPALPPPEEEEAATKTAGPVVQIINGEIVLQESSLMVPNARKTVAEVEEEYQQVVEEEGHSAVVGASYNSFSSRRKPQHWSVDETRTFYNALRQVGTDFACMEAYFDKRTRKQLKRKYQIESTKNPHLIEMALSPKARVSINLSVFKMDKASVQASTSDKTTTTEQEKALPAASQAPTEEQAAPKNVAAAPNIEPEQMEKEETKEEQEEQDEGAQSASNFDSIFGLPLDDEVKAMDDFDMDEQAKLPDPMDEDFAAMNDEAAEVPLAPATRKASKAKSKRKFKVNKGRKRKK